MVCPFNNITQHEQALVWNPYKGILGIWYEWEIVDNKFNSMLMPNGDDCGSHGSRMTKLFLVCNHDSEVTKVIHTSEPSTCKYEVKLSTPLACENEQTHEQTLLVYPYLSKSMQDQWDRTLTEFKNNLITEKV